MPQRVVFVMTLALWTSAHRSQTFLAKFFVVEKWCFFSPIGRHDRRQVPWRFEAHRVVDRLKPFA